MTKHDMFFFCFFPVISKETISHGQSVPNANRIIVLSLPTKSQDLLMSLCALEIFIALVVKPGNLAQLANAPIYLGDTISV
jgi:hypothetical protein